MTAKHSFFRTLTHAAALSCVVAFLTKPLSAQSPTRYCTPGPVVACIAASVATTPRGAGGVNVTIRVANLEGTFVANVPDLVASQLYAIDMIGPAGFAAGTPGPLTVDIVAPAEKAGDVEDRWYVSEVAEPGEYRGYALYTDIDKSGADIIGCTRPSGLGYPYYRTCGASSNAGAVVFQFTTPATWTTRQLSVTFGFRVGGKDLACEVPGTQWDSADVPNCVSSDDDDLDGVPNVSDNCPTVANLYQADGDGDKNGDACDPVFTATADFQPSTISLASTVLVNAVLLSQPGFDASAVTLANTRLHISGGGLVAPMMRGTGYVTSLRDVNGDGRLDRLISFSLSALRAVGLSSGFAALTLRDDLSTVKWEALSRTSINVTP